MIRSIHRLRRRLWKHEEGLVSVARKERQETFCRKEVRDGIEHCLIGSKRIIELLETEKH